MKIKIHSIEYTHPKNVVDNNYFLDYYSNMNIDISKLINSTGRNTRYISKDPNENALTLAIEAAEKVLRTSNLDKDDIDLIVCASTTPEYLAPSQAMCIHRALNCGKRTLAYDMNANCAGLVIAMEQVSYIMKSNNKIKHALVIGTDQLFRHATPSDPMSYANFAESACALILESTDDNSKSDFIDSTVISLNEYGDKTFFPPKGLSTLLSKKEPLQEEDTSIKNYKSDPTAINSSSIIEINELLTNNNLKLSDISLYCLSQFSKHIISDVKDTLEEPEEKFPFVGDRFGYTGVTSPFLALKDSIEKGKLQRGDYVIMWTVGVGAIAPAILFKY